MKKKGIILSMMAVMLVALFGVGFAACGDDDNGGSGSNVVGVWKGKDGSTTITLSFNSNNTGMYVEVYDDKYSGEEVISTSFTYSMVDATKGIISIKVPDEWYSGSSTWTYYFVINGNTMSLYDDDFYDDLEYVLSKQ